MLINIVLEAYEIEQQLQRLPEKFSATPDSLPSIALKKLATSLALPLSRLFNISMATGCLPSVWKTAIVSPLFKKGSRSDPSNYRPVALTSVCCNVMESIIARRMTNHLDDQMLLSPDQFGFRRNRSTTSQLVLFQHEIMSHLSDGDSVDVAYIDLSKAFDTVAFP